MAIACPSVMWIIDSKSLSSVILSSELMEFGCLSERVFEEYSTVLADSETQIMGIGRKN